MQLADLPFGVDMGFRSYLTCFLNWPLTVANDGEKGRSP